MIYIYIYIIYIYPYINIDICSTSVLRGIVGHQVKGTGVGAHHNRQKPSLPRAAEDCWGLWQVSAHLMCQLLSVVRSLNCPFTNQFKNQSQASNLPTSIYHPCRCLNWRLQGAPLHTGCKSPWALPCSPHNFDNFGGVNPSRFPANVQRCPEMSRD